ncbi:MAG: hypothetical protein RBR47_02720 [Bacteroidales bacterium]|jgi:hypothetical protein|nr:hypothetical protein [Bacteroidales bacterium]NCU34573.1 hypothetical protein [Candidatus Falkowbacteria bacterium]MDD2631599.1 hypothetical protein [Bacteroidales bacterium]MDD3130929.1 hypothetical protein [Bacteroidales bacterium]MDD4176522.1 hypothetical protein [Bacteroidales bacterium]
MTNKLQVSNPKFQTPEQFGQALKKKFIAGWSLTPAFRPGEKRIANSLGFSPKKLVLRFDF